jgi:hypothetical protein
MSAVTKRDPDYEKLHDARHVMAKELRALRDLLNGFGGVHKGTEDRVNDGYLSDLQIEDLRSFASDFMRSIVAVRDAQKTIDEKADR